jgi:hypothetical protein
MENKERLQKLYQEALDLSFSGFSISDFVVVQTYKFEEEDKWIKDSKSVFITCKSCGNHNLHQVCNHLEKLFGFECTLEIL